MRREGGGGEGRGRGGSGSPAVEWLQTLRAQRGEELGLREVRYPKGSTLYTENEPAYWTFLIVEGFVDVVKRTPGGKRFILDRMGPGELLGMEALAAHQERVRAFCAEAVTEVRALLLDLPAWEAILRHQEAHRPVLRLFGEALLHRERRLGTLLAPGSPERIQETRAYLCQKFNGYAPPLTQRELAQLTGYTPETVCKRSLKGPLTSLTSP